MPLCITKYKCAFCGKEFTTLNACRSCESKHDEGHDLDGLKLPVRYRSKHVKIESKELELRMDHYAAVWQLKQCPTDFVLRYAEAEAFRRLDCYLRGIQYQKEPKAA